MDGQKAVPLGYMLIGEVAKKMGTTVRTLQYYDREGILSPSAESVGGRRLYTDKDIVLLHQIQTMKFLGLSLAEIKHRLNTLETPKEVAGVLREQAEGIREKIASLSETLSTIEKLEAEILQMEQVDFSKYAAIVANLQMKNELYWVIKHVDNQTLDHLSNHFDKEGATAIIEKMRNLQDEAIHLQKQGVCPKSEVGQNFAKAFWEAVREATGGDIALLKSMVEIVEQTEDAVYLEKQAIAERFIDPAMECYFETLGYNPFEEEKSV